ncbi:MAG: DNA-directed RNA polymerase subunit omega [Planctomycetes bacterium]|nr:DNA-directed RNA polymerase subunit omega [Planctomycetota bacterium]MBM4080428.1 DNA-directed RNA polymerase subunit omega [Planctomycetota bacterium]
MPEMDLEVLTKKVGGRFKLTALAQKRWVELMRGAPKLVALDSKFPIDIVFHEVVDEKIQLAPGEEGAAVLSFKQTEKKDEDEK